MYKKVSQLYPESLLFASPMENRGDRVIAYPENIETEMQAFTESELTSRFGRADFSLPRRTVVRGDHEGSHYRCLNRHRSSVAQRAVAQKYQVFVIGQNYRRGQAQTR